VNGLPIQLVSSEEAWDAGRHARTPLGITISQANLGGPSVARLMQDAAQFVAGSLSRQGFRLLRNGGTPLLERRWHDWTAEIVLRQHGAGIRGTYAPLTVDLHVNNNRLAEVRSRYWKGTGRGAGHVGSVNLGTLICSTARGAIFNLVHEDAAPMLAMALSDGGMLWVDRSTNPAGWDMDSQPAIDSQTTLELLLTYHGWGRAGRYLQSVLSEDSKMSDAVRGYHRRIERGQMACLIGDRLPRNLAVVASAYDLL
jgi:hypothetical protein